MKKGMKKNTKLIVFFEILILILSIISFSFIVGNNIKNVSASVDNTLSQTYQGEIYQGQYKDYYTEHFRNEKSNCCLEMGNGAVCQNVPSNYNDCKQELQSSGCLEVPDCELGCCMDDNEGLCTTNSPKRLCDISAGRFEKGSKCDTSECDKNCCILNNKAEYVTDKRCERLSSLQGIQKNFIQTENELECLKLSEDAVMGACMFENKNCLFTSKEICDSMTGKFYEKLLCSNPSLNTTCRKQEYTNCLTEKGKDEIYFFDSCGNRENIYNSDKELSWNNGQVLKKEESCNPASPNTNSEDCGNCNRMLGSICDGASILGKKIKDGDYVCKDLNCVEGNGTIRQNGESWCDYESKLGNGKSTVGSRYWRQVCTNGEILVEPCADYRNELCAEEKIKNEAGIEISSATCRINRWKNCLGINTLKDKAKEKCEKDKDCDWRNVLFGDTDFDVCTPKYPAGFDLGNGTAGSGANNRESCSTADQTCIVVFICGKCVTNCDCLEEKDTKSWNDYCQSLGDCGAQVNYIGKVTEGGYKIKEGAKLGSEYLAGLKTLIIPELGKFILPGNVSDYYNIYWKGIDTTDPEIKSSTGAAPAPPPAGGNAMGAIGTVVGGTIGGFAATAGATVAGTSTGIGMMSGIMMGMGIVGAIVALLAVAGVLPGLGAACPPKIVEVEFKCMQWQAPLGTDDCEKCNSDPLKPCSEYRCSSLGTACKLLNPETKNPLCVAASVDDKRPPVLKIPSNSKFDNVLGNGSITNYLKIFQKISKVKLDQSGNKITISSTDGGCVKAFAPFVFKLETNKPSECRYSYVNDSFFDEMTPGFLEGNSFTLEHTFMSMLPSLKSLPKGDLGIWEDYRKNRKLNIYVKCQDEFGNKNSESYVLDMCISDEEDKEPAEILYYSPENNGYFSYGNKTALAVYLDEPAECKLSKGDKEYQAMENTMNCKTELVDMTLFGWPCYFNATGLKDTSTFYIKCKDQPWLFGEETGKRNINPESFIYTLKNSKSSLLITSISPSGEVTRAREPAELKLEARTTGGAENGIASCSYEFLNVNWSGNFLETDARTHRQTFSSFPKGTYSLRVTCADVAGNKATNETSLNLIIDKEPPIAIRLYNEFGTLTVITNENAECFYKYNSCSFDISGNATNIKAQKMSASGLTTEKHSVSSIYGFPLYIKCKDSFGNAPSGCTIIAKNG